jgi:hypothetical protein
MNCRSLGFAPPDFLWNLVVLTDFMRLSLRERRTRDLVQCSVAGNPGRDDKGEGNGSIENGCQTEAFFITLDGHGPMTTLYVTVALSFVIPSVPGFPTSPLSPATTYVVLPKENHMYLTEAATLDRKSGEAEGSAVHSTGNQCRAAATRCSGTERKSHRSGDALDIFAALGVLFFGVQMLQHQRRIRPELR